MHPTGGGRTHGQSPAQELAAQVNRLIGDGHYQRAIQMAEQGLQRYRKDVSLLYLLGMAQCLAGQFAQGEASTRLALKQFPNDPRLLLQLALCLQHQHRYDEARQALEQAEGRAGDHPAVAIGWARFHLFVGEAEEGYARLKPMVDSGSNDINIITPFASFCHSLGHYDEGIGAVERAIRQGDIPRVQLTPALSYLGQLYDSAGLYSRAIEVYARFNRAVGARFDRAGHARSVDAIIGNWTWDFIANRPDIRQATDLPVFIVGMPRSGTTLVEQILASHRQIAGGGERPYLGEIAWHLQGDPNAQFAHLPKVGGLDRKVLEKQAGEYLRRLRAHGKDAVRITDKMPDNFLRLGLINLMLPEARIIHCTRHPLDTCLSCFFQQFSGANPWAYDLRDIASYYRDYRRVTDHWRSVLSIPMMEISYEDLVANQAARSRELVEFVGLEWDEACLAFHKTRRQIRTVSQQQVKKPMYRSSVHRYKNYQKWIGPLMDELKDLMPG